MDSLLPQFLYLHQTRDLGTALSGVYNPLLVTLSVLIAILAAYAALGGAGRISVAETLVAKRIWLATGSVAMGIGVWAMHFIGMLAFTLPVEVGYDVQITVVSMVPAIVASGIALYLLAHERISVWRLIIGGTLMGAGIGVMHYTGMMAMRMYSVMLFDPVMFIVSVLVAVALSVAALYTKFLASDDTQSLLHWTNFASALVMGLAVSGMHYTGMSAVYFFPGEGTWVREYLVGDTLDPVWLVAWVGVITVMIIGLAILMIVVDRRMEAAGKHFMSQAPSKNAAKTMKSVSRNFNFAMLAVVSALLLCFALVAILITIKLSEQELEQKLSNSVNFAKTGLGQALWNLDDKITTDFINSILQDEAFIYAGVQWDKEIVAEKKHPSFETLSTEEIKNSQKFITKTAEIQFEGKDVGTFVVAVSRESILLKIILNALGTLALAICVIAGVSATSLFVTRKYISEPLLHLHQSASKIAKGDLEVPIEVNRQDEFGILAQNLDVMRGSIKALVGELRESNHTLEDRVDQRTSELAEANNQITALNEQLQADNLRMGAELDVTRRLQQMLLPKTDELLQIEGLDIACHMQAAVEVGGDYYDVLQHDDRVKIGIGDVTGHGLESGVVMLMTQAIVRALLTSGETNPVRFLTALNYALCGNIKRMGSDKNMTLCLLDYNAGEVKISGQHEEMIVVRRNSEVELVNTIDLGFPVGLETEIADFIGQTTVKLKTGDGVVLYTDGITEAENMANKQYGQKRLCKVVQKHWKKPAEAIKEAVVSDLKRYIGKQTVFDDITLVVAKQV
jgi:serine phosphatase RsbU (regulator of sigma subunit)/NO-binding membrane sensor protein with MHYT domain